MRLSPIEVAAIKAAARLTFGPEAIVRLFGSRIDDSRRGGDIDLHVETATKMDIWQMKDVFLTHLFARLDEQRVDIIATARGATPTPIERIAYERGIIL